VVRLPWGDVDTLDFLNQRVDTLGKRFRIAERFDIVAKPGITAAARPEQWTVVVNTNGQYALFEFTGALPRAKLYANWLVSTNDGATLKQLADPSFDPAQIVLVANKLPPPQPSAITNQDVGTVEFVSYAPKQIQLRASVKAPAVLLLNDRFTPNWQVLVDGQLQPLLRCNYLMRGVTMSPGEHSVEFRFAPHLKGLYVSLAGLALGLALVGFLIISKPKFEPPPAPSAGNPAVKSPPQKPTNRSGAPRTSTAC
jgi:hypothetical protein